MITSRQSITDAALYYVDEVYKKADKCFTKDGNFIATVQLCTILNNMQTIRDKLSPPGPSDGISEPKPVGIIDELGLQEFFDWLEQEKGIGLKLKEFVNRTMHNAADDINHKMHVVTGQLGQQVNFERPNHFCAYILTFCLLVHSCNSKIHGGYCSDMWRSTIRKSKSYLYLYP